MEIDTIAKDSRINIRCCVFYLPPKEAATATEPTTEPATVPAAVATAAAPAPTTGIIVPNVGAKALNPAAIAGAAKPIHVHLTSKSQNAILHLLEIFKDSTMQKIARQ